MSSNDIETGTCMLSNMPGNLFTVTYVVVVYYSDQLFRVDTHVEKRHSQKTRLVQNCNIASKGAQRVG